MKGVRSWRQFATGLGLLLWLGSACSKQEPARSSTSKPREPRAVPHGSISTSDVPRIRIEISRRGMDTLRQYQWAWGGNSWERTNVLATVREGDAVYRNVAIHLKGGAGSFRSVDQKPALTLSFDKVEEAQRFHGLKKIHLNNSVQDPSYLSEQLSRELFEAAGVPVPRASHAIVELNGRALGLYVLVEGWNKQFLKRYFQNTKGNLYDGGFAKDITYPLEVNSGDNPDDRSALEALVKAAQEPDISARLVRLEKVLDVDHFLSFIAMEVLLAHWDGYAMNRNNYRVYHDLDSNRMVFFPHGLDQMFGTWKARPDSPITPQMQGMVARSLLQIPEGRRRYLERMAYLVTNHFDAQALTSRAQQLAAKIRPLLAEDGEWAVLQHRNAVDALCRRIEQRARSVREQLATPSHPLKFDSSGSVSLTGWKAKTDLGSLNFSTRAAKGQDMLQISASGGSVAGSWRKKVLLEQGHYVFSGKIKTEGVVLTAGDLKSGVGLRMSRAPLGQRLAGDTPWTAVSFEFDIPGISDVELVCELRASGGQAWFDLASLKLTRQ